MQRATDNRNKGAKKAHTHYPVHHKHKANQIQQRIVFLSACPLHCPHNTVQDPTYPTK